MDMLAPPLEPAAVAPGRDPSKSALAPAPRRTERSGAGPDQSRGTAVATVPAAVVVVPVRPGGLGSLRPVLASLARSRAAGDVPAAPGSLAVLILSAEPEALGVAEALAPDYPFPLRLEPGPGDAVLAARRAAAWASEWGPGPEGVSAGAEIPVLLLPSDGRPVPPRWAHGLLQALRDGADLVTRRAGAAAWLLGAGRPPVALSGRALRAMDRWTGAGGPVPRGGAWTERGSPWRRPARAGLRAVAA